LIIVAVMAYEAASARQRHLSKEKRHRFPDAAFAL